MWTRGQCYDDDAMSFSPILLPAQLCPFSPKLTKTLSIPNHNLIHHALYPGLKHNPAVLFKVSVPVTEECPNFLSQQKSHLITWSLLTFPVHSHYGPTYKPYPTHKAREDQPVWHLCALIFLSSHYTNHSHTYFHCKLFQYMYTDSQLIWTTCHLF